MALSPARSSLAMCQWKQAHPGLFLICLFHRHWKSVISGVLLLLLSDLAIAQDDKWLVNPQHPGVSQDKPLCKNLLKYLNSYQGCPGNTMATFPGFSSPPWQELDPKEHLDLIWRLLMYRGRADRYFRRGTGAKLPPIHDMPATRRVATDFVARGGKLRVWRARLFNNYALGQSALPGEQTIVELRQSFSYDPKKPDPCLDNPKLWSGSTYIVTSDLKGPDPQVDGGTAGLLESGELLLYEGDPYLVIGYGRIIRMQTSADFPDSYPLQYCGFRFDPLGVNQ